MPTETVTAETIGEENVLLIATAPDAVVMEQIKEYGTEETVAVDAVDTQTAEPTLLDNALTIGIVAAMAIAVIVMIIRKAICNKKFGEAPVAEEPASVAEAPTAPGAAGDVKLHNVDPKTAAMLMAIVADKTGKPLNELRFISIKEVE